MSRYINQGCLRGILWYPHRFIFAFKFHLGNVTTRHIYPQRISSTDKWRKFGLLLILLPFFYSLSCNRKVRPWEDHTTMLQSRSYNLFFQFDSKTCFSIRCFQMEIAYTEAVLLNACCVFHQNEKAYFGMHYKGCEAHTCVVFYNIPKIRMFVLGPRLKMNHKKNVFIIFVTLPCQPRACGKEASYFKTLRWAL